MELKATSIGFSESFPSRYWPDPDHLSLRKAGAFWSRVGEEGLNPQAGGKMNQRPLKVGNCPTHPSLFRGTESSCLHPLPLPINVLSPIVDNLSARCFSVLRTCLYDPFGARTICPKRLLCIFGPKLALGEQARIRVGSSQFFHSFSSDYPLYYSSHPTCRSYDSQHCLWEVKGGGGLLPFWPLESWLDPSINSHLVCVLWFGMLHFISG